MLHMTRLCWLRSANKYHLRFSSVGIIGSFPSNLSYNLSYNFSRDRSLCPLKRRRTNARVKSESLAIRQYREVMAVEWVPWTWTNNIWQLTEFLANFMKCKCYRCNMLGPIPFWVCVNMLWDSLWWFSWLVGCC